MPRHHILRRHPAVPSIPDLDDNNDIGIGSTSSPQPSRGSRPRSGQLVDQTQFQTPPSRGTPTGPQGPAPQLLPSSGGTPRLHSLHNPVTAAQNVFLSIFGRGNGQRQRQQAAVVQVMEEEGPSEEGEEEDELGHREVYMDGDDEEEEEEETTEANLSRGFNDVDTDGNDELDADADAGEMVGEDFHIEDGMEEQLDDEEMEDEDEMMRDRGMLPCLCLVAHLRLALPHR